MRIQSLHLDSFAGLNDRKVDFAPGLNILLGPNEAGKSTLVDAIFITLFRVTNPARNSKEYKELLKYLPYPGGKSIRTSLVMTDDHQEYRLEKEWGSQPRTELRLDGQLVREPGEIKKILNDLLQLGEGTYDKIVFAKQRGFQDVLERLAGDPEAARTLSGVLRQAVMELDGVSIEELKKKIEDTYNGLADHWDRAAQRPENNRGIQNPWKQKVGTVLDTYYTKERLKYEVDAAREAEERYATAADELKEKTAREKELNEEIRILSALENDMVKRASLETRLQALEKENARLLKINQEAPVRKTQIEKNQEEKQQREASLETVEKELKQAEALAAISTDMGILKKAAEIEEKMAAEEQAMAKIEQFTDAVVRELDQWSRQQREAEVAMEAAQLKGIYMAGSASLQLQDGMGETTDILPGGEFSADGYLKLTIGDDAEIEVASGEIDYRVLIARYREAQEKIRSILENLKADSVGTVKTQNEVLREKKGNLSALKKALADLLQGRDRAAMQENVDRMQGVSTRPRQELEKLKYETFTRITQLESEIKQDEQILQQWEKEYGQLDNVVQLLLKNLTDTGEVKQDIAALPELPEEFTDVTEFKNNLERSRNELSVLAEQVETVRGTYYQVKNELARMDSPEELGRQLGDAEQAFRRAQENLENMALVRETFHATVQDMDQNTYDPLVKSFGRYLAILTGGRYSTGQIQDTLAVEITREDGVNIPAALFSTGTYDCVSLAFRLAVLDNIFVEKPGMVVLDDCLVNMDESRRKEAVALIQEFSKKNQVIFSTCTPEVASILGGNLIQV